MFLLPPFSLLFRAGLRTGGPGTAVCLRRLSAPMILRTVAGRQPWEFKPRGAAQASIEAVYYRRFQRDRDPFGGGVVREALLIGLSEGSRVLCAGWRQIWPTLGVRGRTPPRVIFEGGLVGYIEFAKGPPQNGFAKTDLVANTQGNCVLSSCDCNHRQATLCLPGNNTEGCPTQRYPYEEYGYYSPMQAISSGGLVGKR